MQERVDKTRPDSSSSRAFPSGVTQGTLEHRIRRQLARSGIKSARRVADDAVAIAAKFFRTSRDKSVGMQLRELLSRETVAYSRTRTPTHTHTRAHVHIHAAL